MSTAADYRDYSINPRIKIAALWTSVLFIFVYVDLFGMYRADVRADIAAGKIAGFSIGQVYLLGVMVYVALPSLMVFLSLVLAVKVTRMVNIVLAALYAVTIAGSAVGEWNYFIVGSLIEAVLLVMIGYYAWTWPKTTKPIDAPSSQTPRDSAMQPTTKVRGSEDMPTSSR